MQKIKEVLSNLIQLSDTEWHTFKNLLSEKTYPAKATLLHAGKTATELYFIVQGLLRIYHLEDGKEISTYFACDDQFVSPFASLITQSPSFQYIEAVEPTSLYSIPYRRLTELYQASSSFEKLGRILAEQNYLCMVERMLILQTKTAKEKYLDFIKNNPPKIVQRTPQHQIASFLGIAPESLSRIRRELVTS